MHQAKTKRTRSEPADKEDPYKTDLLEQQLIAKYEKMLAEDNIN